MNAPAFAPAADRRNALDRAHIGDIEGALGTVSAVDTGPRWSRRRKLLTLLAVLGPGVVVMVADNDAGTISVFAQAGQNHGMRLLWVLALVAPALYVIQEMAARLGAVTGSGHARLTLERFGTAIVVLASAIVLAPGLPLGAVTTLVQALAGILLPCMLVLLLILCNDDQLLGPMTNGPLQNLAAGLAVAVMLVLTTLLTLTTAFPQLPTATALAATVALLSAGACLRSAVWRRREHRGRSGA